MQSRLNFKAREEKTHKILKPFLPLKDVVNIVTDFDRVEASQIIAFDLSLRSPALAIYCTKTKRWDLYGFAQLKSQRSIKQKALGENVFVTLFDIIPDAQSASDPQRYEYIISRFLSVIEPQRVQQGRIEGYAFPSKKFRGFNYKLQELGGALKYALLLRGITLEVVGSTSWKKQVLGSSTASKMDAVVEQREREPHINLLELVKNPTITKGKRKDPPSPVQDLADAMCIVKFCK